MSTNKTANRWRLKFFSGVLFLLLFTTGILLSLHKPLWNDELFTQTQGLEKLSYSEITLGQIPEGNNFPLFYLIQKSFNDLSRFQFPLSWDDREWELAEPRSQIILRIPANICMSAALTALFYFFFIEFGIGAGIFAFILGLATPTVWIFWAEERPYALWFLLTTLQLILFIKSFEPTTHKKTLRWLNVVHILLALTITWGALQAILAGMIFFLRKQTKAREQIFLTIIPLLIGCIYFTLGLKFSFGVPSVWPIVLKNIPLDRLVLIVIYTLLLAFMNFRKGRGERPKIHLELLLFVFLIGLLTAGMIIRYKSVPSTGPFILTERHFLCLAPLGIIATTIFLTDILNLFKENSWARVNILFIACGFLIAEFLETLMNVFWKSSFFH